MKESDSDGSLNREAGKNEGGLKGERSSSLPRWIRPPSLPLLEEVDYLKGVKMAVEANEETVASARDLRCLKTIQFIENQLSHAIS